MKRKSYRGLPLLFAISLTVAGPAIAANLYWDGTDSTANADGGAGTWNTTLTNWDSAATAGSNATWNNATPDVATFGGTGGVVALGTSITAGSVNFSVTGYTLALGGNTLTFGSTAAAGTSSTFRAISGAGTLNLSLGSGSATNSFGATADFSAFTGTINIGTSSQAAGSGKAQINSTAGPLAAGVTVNVRANSTLFASSALTHLAAITLNGGDTGETLGQLRLESGANWGGTVTLAGDIASANDALLGANTSAAGAVSGNIVESGGTRTLIKGGGGTITLSGTNGFTGGTVVRAGTLTLDYTTNNTNKLATGGTVSLGAGSALRFTGNAGAATTQGAGGLTLLGAGVAIVLDTAAGQTLTADFTGGGAGVFTGSDYGLSITPTGGGTARVKLPGTSPSTILPGITYGGSFAATDSSNFVTAASMIDNTTGNDLATWTSGPTQYTTTGTDFINAVGSGVSIDGVTFSDAASQRSVVIGTGNTLTVNRGIIVSADVGSAVSSVTGGSIRGPVGGALVCAVNSPATEALTIGSTIVDNGGSSLVKMGPGVLYLTAVNSYTGGTTLTSGSLKLGHTGALGSGPVALNVSSTGAINLSALGGSQNLANNLVLGGFTTGGPGVNAAPGTADVVELSGVISGGSATSTFSLMSAGTTSTGVKFILSGNNSYNGSTSCFGVGVQLNHPNGFGNSTVSFLQTADTVLTFGAPMTVTNPMIYGAGTKRIDTNGHDVTLSGLQTFSVPVTKVGTGKLTLTNANAGTGALTVGAGTLALGSGGTLSNATVTVAGGAVLDASAMTGGYTVATGKTLVAGDSNPAADVLGNLTLAAGTGALNPAGDSAAGTFTVDGNLTLNGGTLRFSNVADQIALAGAGRVLGLAGTNTVTGPMGFLPPGSYTLVSGYTSHTGDATNLAYNSAVIRGGSHSFDVGSAATTLTVNGTPLSLVWKGAAASTVWDINTTANWNSNAEKFYQWDAVTFADSPANTTVTIAGTVCPSAIAFTNAVSAYTVRGGTSPVIAGTAAMTKSGAATVTLWHPSNTYSGGTTINAGTLNLNLGATVATGSYSPLGSGLVTINGGTLQINPSNGGGNTTTLTNAVRLNGGTLYQDDGITVINGQVTVDAASVIRAHYGGKNITLAGGLAGSAPLKISNTNGGYGPGAVLLSAVGTYSGTLTVDNTGTNYDGALFVSHDSALSSAKLVLNTTASVQNSTNVGLTLSGAATNVTIAGLSGSNANARIHNADSTTRTLTVNQSTDSSFAGGIGDGSANGNKINLVKSGSGQLTLSANDTYTGNTTVTGGKLVLKTRSSANMDLTVGDGAALGVDSTGVSLFIDSVSLGTAGATTLAVTNFPANSAVPVIDCLDLANNGTTSVSVSGVFTPGRYELIRYTTMTGSGSFTLAPLPRGVNGELKLDSGSSVDLVIGSSSSLVWTGGSSAVWNINTAANWKLGAVDPDVYLDNDNVLFDGTGANRAVTLDVAVAPASLTFAGAESHSITGTGAIAGTTGIVKNGSGTLTLGTPNTFTGPVAINGGTVVLENDAGLGGAATGTTVAAGATLDLNGRTVGGETVSLGGSLVNTGATAASLGGGIAITDSATIDSTGNLTLSGNLTGSAGVEKTGDGTLTLTAQSAAYTGTVTVGQGTLVVGVFKALEKAPVVIGDGGTVNVTASNGFQWHSQPITVKSGGTLQVTATTTNIGPSGTFTMEGGAMLAAVNPDTHWGSWSINNTSGPSGGTLLTVAGGSPTAATISAALVTPSQPVLNLSVADVTGSEAADLVVSGSFGSPASTAFGVLINGGGKVLLNGANTYTGTTTVESGSALGGTGVIAGPVSVAGTLAPGLDGLAGTLTVAQSATLSGHYACDLGATAADRIIVTGDLDLTGAILDLNADTLAAGNVIASYTGSRTGQFATVNGLPSGYSVMYDDTHKLVRVVKPGYSTWAAVNAPTGAAGDDFDGDGVSNAVEYVLGGDKNTNDLGKLPTVGGSGGDMTFSFVRNKDTIQDTTVAIQVDTDLADWPVSGPDYYPVPATAVANNPGVTVVDNVTPANTQTVTLTIHRTPDPAKFARLEVTVN